MPASSLVLPHAAGLAAAGCGADNAAMLSLHILARRLARARRTTLFAVVLFVCGGLAHLVHHIEDPTCDRGPAPVSHVCASCAALHAGATAKQPPAIINVEPACSIPPADAGAHPVLRAPARDSAPRAPPFA